MRSIDIYYDLDLKKNQESSYEFYRRLLETEDVGGIESITVYAHNENMLLNKFVPYLPSNSSHMVIKTEKALIFLSHVRCGYMGNGPHESIRVIDHSFPEWAERNREKIEYAIFRNQVVEIQKEYGDPIIREGNSVFIAGNTIMDQHYMNLDNLNFDVDLGNRVVRIFNPQLTNFLGTIRLIQNMRLRRMDYYIGEDSPLDNHYRFSHNSGVNARYFKEERYYTQGVTGVNIALMGDVYDIFILVNKNDALAVLNAIYLQLFHEPLFYCTDAANFQEMDTTKKRLWPFSFKKKRPIIQGSKEYVAEEVYADLNRCKMGISHGMELKSYDAF